MDAYQLMIYNEWYERNLKKMGLVISEEENPQAVVVEIRRESIVIMNPGPASPTTTCGECGMTFVTSDDAMIYPSGTGVEMDKRYLRRLLHFFREHPEHLEYPPE